MEELKQVGDADGMARLKAHLTQLGSVQARVGWFPDSKYESGRSVAEVAAGNEFGISSRSIPPRPFMRPASIKHSGEWAEIASAGAKQVLAGNGSAEEVFERVAIAAEGDVANNIAKLTDPPLSKITIAARAYKKRGITITGSVIGQIAGKIKAGEAIDTSGVSDKPLIDSGIMFSTLTHVTEKI